MEIKIIKQDDFIKSIPQLKLLKGSHSIASRALKQLVIKILCVISNYMAPLILIYDWGYFYLVIAIFINYYLQYQHEQQLQSMLLVINTTLSRQLFDQCLRSKPHTTFQGILRELRQVEKATRSFYTLFGISFELPFVYYLLEGLAYNSMKYGIIISLLALVAASFAQIYAWRLQHFQDRRLRLTQDMLVGIKSIKYLQWEQVYLNLIKEEREAEFNGNKGIQYVDTFINFFRRMSQIVLLYVAFSQIQDLQPEKFYEFLIFFSLLVHPLNTFPWCLGEFLGSFLSIIRLRDYFQTKDPEIQLIENTLIFKQDIQLRIFDKVINLIRGDNSKKQGFDFRLKLDFSLTEWKSKSNITCIIGQVGSGKTTFLEYFCDGSYAGQQPWIFSGTVKDNILFGREYDEQHYLKCLRAAAIDFDEQKECGFNGTNLSGGQRQRISFCRAIYSKADSYYFDDIFSSVDENIADHMFKSIKEFLHNKRVVIVLNQLQYLQYADYVIKIEDGIAKLSKNASQLIGDIKMNLEINTVDDSPIQQIQEIEKETEQNLVKNYSFYIKCLGIPTLIFFLTTSTLQQAIKGLFELWIHSNFKSLDQNTLYQLFLWLTIFTFVRGFAYSYSTLVSARVIFNQLMIRILYLPVKYFDIFSTNFYIKRLFGDMSEIDDLPLNWFFSVALDGLSLIVIVATIQIEIIPYCMAVIYFLIKVQKTYRKNKVYVQEKINQFYVHTDFNNFIIETEKGSQFIKNFNQQPLMQSKFNKILEYQYTKDFSLAFVNNQLQFQNFLIETIAFLLLVLTGNKLSYTYAYLLFGGQLISKSIEGWRRVLQVSQSLQRITQIFGLQTEQEEKGHLQPSLNTIEFENVTLSYQQAKGQAQQNLALRGISFSVQQGQKVAFCGRTGSGKSSIFNLMVRLYEHLDGQISVYGNDIRNYSINQLRSMINVLPQQGLIIKGNVRKNIDPLNKLTEAQIQQYSDKFKINFTKDSQNLSQGERQLVNFIQSMIVEKEIILIDEATSNMDPDTNNFIMKTVFEMAEGKTLMLISHRLENLQKFDMIYVLENGKIVENGTYKQLISNEGAFCDLMSKL
ncbi:hypothetical protein pb186bvf_020220 [Paramecium bursaria]